MVSFEPEKGISFACEDSWSALGHMWEETDVQKGESLGNKITEMAKKEIINKVRESLLYIN